ncbi:heterokaryon incompatibility protein-domain-containing protein [Tricladium varicosporioides]|nr:heterokaryon incompatibility protein-domain-containing protein [Hymenoscyphus varicosporioides]
MDRFSNTFRKLSSIRSSDTGSDSLCKSCCGLILEPRLLQEFPETTLPGGSFAVDLREGFLDLPLKRKDIYPGLPSLNASAAKGCRFCKLLLEVIESHQQRSLSLETDSIPRGDIHISFRYNCASEPGSQTFNLGEWPVILHALEAIVSSSGEPVLLTFRLLCEEGHYLRIRGRSIDPTTLSPKNISMINQWIQRCEQSHEICSGAVSRDRLSRPKRLLHLGDLDRSPQPLLVETESMELLVKYAALSYCWGPPSSLRMITTRRTLSSRMNGLSLEEIPQTFRDAFSVCRCLGINYIWIDSLCIIQDNEEDWAHEAAIMGDIYRQAYVTIIAASSKSTNDGFLRRHPPARSVSLPFRSQKHPRISGEYSVSFMGSETYPAEFVSDVERSTWNERGWTFQERLLSHRSIYFGQQQIYFECKTQRHAENYGSPLKLKLPWHKYLSQGSGLKDLERQWRWLVEQYSRRSFTFEKDRLPALVGLVGDTQRARVRFNTTLPAGAADDYIGRNGPLEYFLGHWDYDLWANLLWRPENIETNDGHRYESLSQIPSWSWCSRGGAVSFAQSQGYHKDCDIIPTDIGMSHPPYDKGVKVMLKVTSLVRRAGLVHDDVLRDFERLKRHDANPLYICFDFHLPLEHFRTAAGGDSPFYLAPLCYMRRSLGFQYRPGGERDLKRVGTANVILLGIVLSPDLPAPKCKWELEFKAHNLEAKRAPSMPMRFRRIGLFEEHLLRFDDEREEYLRLTYKRQDYEIW